MWQSYGQKQLAFLGPLAAEPLDEHQIYGPSLNQPHEVCLPAQ